jgi:hypothetical protein
VLSQPPYEPRDTWLTLLILAARLLQGGIDGSEARGMVPLLVRLEDGNAENPTRTSKDENSVFLECSEMTWLWVAAGFC